MSQPDVPAGRNSADDNKRSFDANLFDNTEMGQIAASVAQRFRQESFDAPASPQAPASNNTRFVVSPGNPLDQIHIGVPAQASPQSTEAPKGDQRPSKQTDATTPNLADQTAQQEVNVEAQRQALAANFTQFGDQKHQQYATQWMIKAEQRVTSGQLSAQELGGTYEQINRLLTTDSPYLTKDERTTVGAEILYHVATPRIDQGLHQTCNATVLENIAFEKNPSMAAKIIADAALTASITGADGKRIKLDAGSLKPGWEERTFFPPEDMLRTHASQLFQVAVLNDVGQRDKESPSAFVQKPEGDASLLFKLGSALPFSEYWMPTGYDVWRERKTGAESDFSGLSPGQIADESKRLFGNKYDVLEYDAMPSMKYSHPWAWAQTGTAELNGIHGYGDSKKMDSENTLRKTLANLKSQDRLPVIVGVNALNPKIDKSETSWLDVFTKVIRPVRSLHDYIDMKLGMINHVVTIKQFDPQKDRVYVSNSAGKDQDGWISVGDLWNAM
ncbi:MAG TPA: hypothetical protein V6D22_06605 [Candidatus Obscuribacterales bacterium]